MKVDGRHYRSIWLEPDGRSVAAIDQRKLPHQFVVARLTSCEEAAESIRSMLVRGAPLIGATAAFGMALAMREDSSDAGLDRAYKTSGYSVIGMTNMPEAKLAREAEICYATVAMVTDFDCWHPDHDAVTVQDIIRVLSSNADKAKALVARLAADFPRQHEPCPIGSDRALDTALITAPEARDPELLGKLDAVAGRVLRA